MSDAERPESEKLSQLGASPVAEDPLTRLWEGADASHGSAVEAVAELRERKRREQEASRSEHRWLRRGPAGLRAERVECEGCKQTVERASAKRVMFSSPGEDPVEHLLCSRCADDARGGLLRLTAHHAQSLRTDAVRGKMTPMEPEGLRAEAKRLRSAEPPRAIRGFDEGETRKLLETAGKLLDAAASEQEAARSELEQLRSATGDEAAGKEAIGKAFLAATRAGEEMAAEARDSAERITAEAETRAAAIVEQATAAAEERTREIAAAREKLEIDLAGARATVEEENAATRTELERERSRLERDQAAWREALEGERTQVLGEAQEKAETILADARHEVEELQSYGGLLRALLTDSRRRFVELAESALQQLEVVEAETDSKQGDLLADLRPPDEAPSVPAVPDD